MRRFHVGIGVAGSQALLPLLLASVAFAQTAPSTVGVFVNANMGMMQPTTDALTSVASHADGIDREEVRLRAPMKASPVFDLGGGVVIRNRWVVGAAFDRSAESAPAELTLTLRHPEFHPTLTATSTTDSLERIETGLHFNAGYRLPITSALALTVFGGPSYLTRQQALLKDLSASEPFNSGTRTYSATIDYFETKSVRSSAWGYNAGVDGSYFVSRHVGIGAQLRYARATFDTDNLLQAQIDERAATDLVEGGGLRFAAGVRLRF